MHADGLEALGCAAEHEAHEVAVRRLSEASKGETDRKVWLHDCVDSICQATHLSCCYNRQAHAAQQLLTRNAHAKGRYKGFVYTVLYMSIQFCLHHKSSRNAMQSLKSSQHSLMSGNDAWCATAHDSATDTISSASEDSTFRDSSNTATPLMVPTADSQLPTDSSSTAEHKPSTAGNATSVIQDLQLIGSNPTALPKEEKVEEEEHVRGTSSNSPVKTESAAHMVVEHVAVSLCQKALTAGTV